uniref:Uncharacterized protein n=1 Tax=Amphimedon queenslandica TaxID=400682 RepID=A0A1X7T8A4_AMPQE
TFSIWFCSLRIGSCSGPILKRSVFLVLVQLCCQNHHF